MEVDDEVIAVMTAENHKEFGNQKYREKNYQSAIDCYSEAIKLEPSNPAYLNNRAAAYIMLSKLEEALEDSGRSFEIDSSQVKSVMRYAKCHLMMGSWDSAIEAYSNALKLDPNQTEAINQINNIALLKKHYESYFNQTEKEDYRHALFSIERCIEASPGSITFKLHKAELLINMKKFSDAKLVLEDFLQRNGQSSSPEALYLRGLCLYYLEHLEKAQSHFQHVLRLNPDHIKAQQAYKRSKLIMKLKEEGNQHVKSGLFDKAFHSYSEALAVDKLHDLLNAKLYANRSFASFNLRNYESALEDSNTAITLDSTYTKAQLRKCKCLIALEKYQDAVNAMEKLCESDPSEENRRMLKEAKLELKKSKRKDYYKILGVVKDANETDIKKAYRKRAMLHHPDRHAHEDDAKRKQEEQKFKEIGEAYNVLSDTKKRQRYDNGADIEDLDNDGCRGYGGVDPYDLFQQMFRDGSYGGGASNPYGNSGQSFSFSFG